jgi:hypothetical protein
VNILARILDDLGDEEKATLRRFRDATEAGQALYAEINVLPSGFLQGAGFDEDHRALFTLSPFGRRVAENLDRSPASADAALALA